MSILGERIDFVSAVSLDHESRGFVKVANSDDSTMARNLIHSIYINLASRALERMVLSPTPKDRTSLTEISNGSVQDVQTATETIYNYIYKFGLNPYGGTIDRNGGEIQHNKFYAPFATLPHSIVTALSYIQNDLEQFILTDLLQKHTIQWYAKKVSELAQAGGMTELEFYQLIEHPLPEKRDSVLASNEHFVDLFGELMESHNEEEHPENSLKTREHHQKILQARQQYTDFFLSSIQTRLPSLTVEDKNHMNKGISCQQLFKTNSR